MGLTPHPAGAAPRGGKLISFRIEHPQPDRVRDALSVLGVDSDVHKANAVQLTASIETKHGIVEIS